MPAKRNSRTKKKKKSITKKPKKKQSSKKKSFLKKTKRKKTSTSKNTKKPSPKKKKPSIKKKTKSKKKPSSKKPLITPSSKQNKETEDFLKSYGLSARTKLFQTCKTKPLSYFENFFLLLKKEGIKKPEIKRNLAFLLENKDVLESIFSSPKLSHKKDFLKLLANLSGKLKKEFIFEISKTALEKNIDPYFILYLPSSPFKNLAKDEKEFKNLIYKLLSIAEHAHGLKPEEIFEELEAYKPFFKNQNLLEALGKAIANIPSYTKAEPKVILSVLKSQKAKIKNASALNEMIFMLSSLANNSLDNNIPPKALFFYALPPFDYLAKDKTTLSLLLKTLLDLGKEAIEQGRDPIELYKYSLPKYSKKISSLEELASLKPDILHI